MICTLVDYDLLIANQTSELMSAINPWKYYQSSTGSELIRKDAIIDTRKREHETACSPPEVEAF
jgi:hypothetical protein